ncbi:MAG TPA: TIM-barrel domain-containing protein, partial [Vicinamibacterales bacterium]|nr:TIM-barrel domain-containing protein [Vicinamibacterales bacterium]
GRPEPIPLDGSLADPASVSGPPAARLRAPGSIRRVRCGPFLVSLESDPPAAVVETPDGRTVQRLRIDPATGVVTFPIGDGPLLGLGQGGPQFDRRGSLDPMRSGQGGYRLRTHGGRVPIQWLVGTSGWAMFIHQPLGTFDFTGPEARFDPGMRPLPLDLFVVDARDPAAAMAAYARLTGLPELPPLWAFGYQQSHRTLQDRDEVLRVARTFREKRLPCDALIYLGTGFTPSGWNTANGSFAFNRRVFDDPAAIIDELHRLGFKVVLHVVILARTLRGRATDPCDLARYDEEEAGCYWNAHRKVFALGVDGWWPDEGDPLDAASRLARNRLYWEGPQIDRPNERPYALHRNGHAGMQRFAAFLWSGDVYSTWETLRTHVAVAVNAGLSGIPYWGTDIGGFVPTAELTGELYVRWFQFGAFCPLFRAHGRTWHLRLPWGWNTGELGPNEIANYREAANPDPAELRNPQVEPICRKYLELRYRLLPYLYSVVREGTRTGLPIVRALWLQYPDDPAAVARGDEYLWGRDLLVAPVVERGATVRRLYLPRGVWYDFWTGDRLEGGREIEREVDLATMPLYVRAGAILPLGPVRQHTGEAVDEPIELRVFPGADGAFLLYEDDGRSFEYRKGDWMGVEARWREASGRLALRLADGSRMRPPSPRPIAVRVLGRPARTIAFGGEPVELALRG